MIYTKQGETEMHGKQFELLTDLSIIVHSIVYDMLIEQDKMSMDAARKVIMDQLEIGLMSTEQIEHLNEQRKNDALRIMNDFIEKLETWIKSTGE